MKVAADPWGRRRKIVKVRLLVAAICKSVYSGIVANNWWWVRHYIMISPMPDCDAQKRVTGSTILNFAGLVITIPPNRPKATSP